MRLVWTTDLHLDLATGAVFHAFCHALREEQPDALLVGGDIAEAPVLQAYILKMREQTGDIPIYFVLGNHDYYHGAVQEVRDQITALCRITPNVHWLEMEGIVALTSATALLGHGGWADGRFGDWDASSVELSDYTRIRDFKHLGKKERLSVMQRLAAEAAEHIRKHLPVALERFQNVLFLTHVPAIRGGLLARGPDQQRRLLAAFRQPGYWRGPARIGAGVSESKDYCALRTHSWRRKGASLAKH